MTTLTALIDLSSQAQLQMSLFGGLLEDNMDMDYQDLLPDDDEVCCMLLYACSCPFLLPSLRSCLLACLLASPSRSGLR